MTEYLLDEDGGPLLDWKGEPIPAFTPFGKRIDPEFTGPAMSKRVDEFTRARAQSDRDNAPTEAAGTALLRKMRSEDARRNKADGS